MYDLDQNEEEGVGAGEMQNGADPKADPAKVTRRA